MTIVNYYDYQQVFGGTSKSRPLNQPYAEKGVFTGFLGPGPTSNIIILGSTLNQPTSFLDTSPMAGGNRNGFLRNPPPNFFAAIQNNIICNTTIDGINWILASSDVTNGIGSGTLGIVTDSLVWLNSGRMVYVNNLCFSYSDDMGVTWTAERWTTRYPSLNGFTWQIASDGEVIKGVAGGGRSIQSIDGGENWTSFSIVYPNFNSRKCKYVPEIESFLVAGVSSTNDPRALYAQKGADNPFILMPTSGITVTGQMTGITYSPQLNTIVGCNFNRLFQKDGDPAIGGWTEIIFPASSSPPDIYWSNRQELFYTGNALNMFTYDGDSITTYTNFFSVGVSCFGVW